jgi:hypothetical protein
MKTCAKQRLCEFVWCKTLPSFGWGKRPTRCKTHSLLGMKYTRFRPLCAFPDCPKQPNFGFANKSAVRCRTHALDGMINKRLNNGINMCAGAGCKRQASFGYVKITYCSKHKDMGMLNLRTTSYPTLGTVFVTNIEEERELIASWGEFDFESDLDAVLFHPIK